jgi:hypothetical protein
MSTDFLTKCKILGEVHAEAQFNNVLQDFKDYHDIGLPLAYILSMDLVNLKENDNDGKDFIEETWTNFCVGLEIDPEKEYEDLDDMIDNSPIIEEEDVFPNKDEE